MTQFNVPYVKPQLERDYEIAGSDMARLQCSMAGQPRLSVLRWRIWGGYRWGNLGGRRGAARLGAGGTCRLVASWHANGLALSAMSGTPGVAASQLRIDTPVVISNRSHAANLPVFHCPLRLAASVSGYA